MKKKWYVGCVLDYCLDTCLDTYRYEAFQDVVPPTETEYGSRYRYVVGPFKTKRAAKWAERYGVRNPHFTGVDAAERLAAKEN